MKYYFSKLNKEGREIYKKIYFSLENFEEKITVKGKTEFVKDIYYMVINDNPMMFYVNPYQIAAANGRYYLIGNYDKYDNVSHYRLDRIMSIELLEAKQKPQKKVIGLENGFDLPKHMAEHIYMFSGESEVVTFRLKKYLLNDVMDFFGSEISFFDETEDSVSARVKVNRSAMQKWALQYALHAQILSPASLVEAVKHDLIKAYGLYSN